MSFIIIVQTSDVLRQWNHVSETAIVKVRKSCSVGFEDVKVVKSSEEQNNYSVRLYNVYRCGYFLTSNLLHTDSYFLPFNLFCNQSKY